MAASGELRQGDDDHLQRGMLVDAVHHLPVPPEQRDKVEKHLRALGAEGGEVPATEGLTFLASISPEYAITAVKKAAGLRRITEESVADTTG